VFICEIRVQIIHWPGQDGLTHLRGVFTNLWHTTNNENLPTLQPSNFVTYLRRRPTMTTNPLTNPGEAQARRLENVYEQVAALLRQPEVARRLRTAAGENEWSAMQVLGHLVEMIPYWLNHCRLIIAATEPHLFGRPADDPERLAGVEQGATGDPDELLSRLHQEVQAAARTIRQLSPEEQDKKGRNIRLGEMPVTTIIEDFIIAHAEAHLAQVQAALRS
jgi:uncharacterized damage-inducible protein DinB